MSMMDLLPGKYGSMLRAKQLMADVSTLVAADRTDYITSAHSYNATAIAAGCATYTIGANFYVFLDTGGGVYDTSAVNETRILAAITAYGELTTPLLFDIEVWSAATQAQKVIDNMKTVLSLWKANSARPIGLYNTIPYLNYWAPVLWHEYAAYPRTRQQSQLHEITTWQRRNDMLMRELGPYVDFLVPYAYQTHADAAGIERWKWSVSAQISEAVRIAGDLPIYPIAGYHIGFPASTMTAPQFTAHLQYLAAFPGVDSIMVWEGSPAPVWTWTDVIGDFVAGTGDFAAEPPP